MYIIGSTTCGKPYGFYPTDNCGTTYFRIQFRGENAANFGDYTDGFSPANTTANVGTTVPGCSVADDFTHELGDPAEGAHRRGAGIPRQQQPDVCPAASGVSDPRLSKASFENAPIGNLWVSKPAARMNRILRRNGGSSRRYSSTESTSTREAVPVFAVSHESGPQTISESVHGVTPACSSSCDAAEDDAGPKRHSSVSVDRRAVADRMIGHFVPRDDLVTVETDVNRSSSMGDRTWTMG